MLIYKAVWAFIKVLFVNKQSPTQRRVSNFFIILTEGTIFLTDLYCKSRLKIYTSAIIAMRCVTALFDATVKQVDSRVTVYKRRVLIGRFGSLPLFCGIDSIHQLLAVTLYHDCKI